MLYRKQKELLKTVLGDVMPSIKWHRSSENAVFTSRNKSVFIHQLKFLVINFYVHLHGRLLFSTNMALYHTIFLVSSR